MLAIRLTRTLVLWVTIASLAAQAWYRSVAASTLDSRIPWGLPIVGAALLAGLVLAGWSARRRPDRWTPLGAERVGLALVVALLAVDALSHVPASTSVKLLREQIAPQFAWLYPALAFVTPLLLGRTGRWIDAADQSLLAILALTTSSGAVVLLTGPTALCLALWVLLAALSASGGRLPDGPLLRVAGATLTLLLLAALTADNPLSARPAVAWPLAAGALGLAVAARPRDRAAWLRLLAAPVVTATLVAVCGVVLTVYLADAVGSRPALNTRLTLFRQHPNFLAPFYAFHAVLALVLALCATGWRRAAGLLAVALLAWSTYGTDSRAGIACLLAGLGGVPALLLAARVARRVRPRTQVLILVGLVTLALIAVLVTGPGRWLTQLERFEKSADYRLDAWRNSLAIVRAHPWLGIGPGTFESVERFQPGSRFYNEPTSPHPHNVFLYVAQAAGIPALLLFIAWVALVVARLWSTLRSDTGPPIILVAGLLSATVALLGANLLDLGLSLDTVIPAPLLLLTGLAIAGDSRRTKPPRPIAGVVWAIAIVALLVPLGLRPVRAATHLERAQLLAYLGSQSQDDPELRAAARRALAAAIATDPDASRAYELLSRWIEQQPDSSMAAHEILRRLVERAPQYGPSRSLLGQLYMRQGLWGQAAEALLAAVASSHGSVYLTRDRADAIECLAREGRREQAMEELIEALRLDPTVIHAIVWRIDPDTRALQLNVGAGRQDQEPLDLVDAVERLFGRHIEEHLAGHAVGRRFWMDTYIAFRKAERDDRAEAVLDYLEANELLPGEPHTIASERAKLAEARGDLDRALELWTLAYELAYETSRPFFQTQAQRVRGQLELGEDGPDDPVVEASSDDQAEAALQASTEILDMPTAFRDNLDSRADNAAAGGRLAHAAGLLERTLIFADDPLERAQRWLQAGILYRRAGEHEAALAALQEALEHLASKPYPLPVLQTGFTSSLPGTIAQEMCTAWQALGLDSEERQDRAWGLDCFFSSWPAPALFRLGVFSENGRVDALLREAELLQLHDADNLLASWAGLEAREGLGRMHEVPDTMRAVAAAWSDRSERLYVNLVNTMHLRMEDPAAWSDLATMNLLRGRYGEAADMFGTARGYLDDDAHTAAHLMGWQSRALVLAERVGGMDAARDLLVQAVETAPSCGILKRRLEAFP